MNGYSYTTISMRPGQSPRVGVSIHPDEHASVRYYPARDTALVFLAVEYGDAWVNIGTTPDTTLTDTHVKFARDLFEAASHFLADCERLRDQHARQATDQAAPEKAA